MANYLGTWLPWLIWEKFRFYEVGEINSKDNNDLGREKSEPTGIRAITYLTISLVRARVQSKYNIPCFSSGMRLGNCLQFQIVHIRFVDST